MRRETNMEAINRYDVWIFRLSDDAEEVLMEDVEWPFAMEIAEAARKALRFCSLLDSVLVMINATAKEEKESR